VSAAVFLVGFMGSGKTATARRLAELLSWGWADLDTEIESSTGLGIPGIFAEEGEAGFRLREREALCRWLTAERVVVACGGGVVLDPRNLEDLLAQPCVYCLRVSPETVFQRVGADRNRPLLQGADPLSRIRELMEARRPLYDRFPCQVDTDGLRPSEVAARIFSDLRKRGLSPA
jgi:shikimate kinase